MSKQFHKQSRRQFLKNSSSLSVAAACSSLGISNLLIAQNAHATNATSDDYKALVFIFLAGGNDAFNTLVPRGAGQLRTDYENARRHVALPTDQLHALQLKQDAKIYGGQNYNDFGLHPACDKLAQMFNDQELAFVCNLGNLLVPTSRQQYLNSEVALPPQLFSHADQQRQFQSSPTSPFRFGWGGRMAELLESHNSGSVSPLLSVSGLNTFQVTKNSVINPYVMSADGAIKLNSFNGERQTLVENSMKALDNSSHYFAKKIRDTFFSAQNAQTIVSNAFEQASATGVDYDALFTAAGATNSKLTRQLKTVAKMIAGRASTGNNRPIYFVKMGGFDTHQNLLSDHQELMADLNASLQGFRDVLVAQGDFDKTLSFVGSEFARTLTPNGDDENTGTDHAWGGHAILMGGMVEGGQLYGTHPDLVLEGDLDASTGRGRWIPTTATSQCSSVIANWMGIDKAELPKIFPSYENLPDPFAPEANLNFIKQVVVS